MNNPTMASKCSSERNSGKSLLLSQKLEMIKCSEEGMSKARRLKARPLAPVRQVVNAKEKLLKEIKSAIPVNTRMVKQKSLIAT